MNITDRYIKSLKPKDKAYEISAGSRSGLRLKIHTTGTKTWIFRYRLNGKQTRVTLGQYGDALTENETGGLSEGKTFLSLKIAIDKASEKRKLVNQGIDPAHEVRINNEEKRKAPTVENLVELYIDRHAKKKKKSWKEDERILKKDVLPEWAKIKIANIRRRDIIAIVDSVADRGAPIGANRTLACIRRMFNYAIERDLLESSPCFRVKASGKEYRRDRVLTENEIKSIWRVLDSGVISPHIGIALKLMLALAQRKGEIINVEWSEIDLINKWWVIPSSKTKNGMAHRVPLPDLAISLFEKIKPFTGISKYVFESPKGDLPIRVDAISKAVLRNQKLFDVEHWTPHDLRRTAASHMVGSGINRLVV